jgi:hypothetical protein
MTADDIVCLGGGTAALLFVLGHWTLQRYKRNKKLLAINLSGLSKQEREYVLTMALIETNSTEYSCCQCGRKDHPEDSSLVTWVCAICKRNVCRRCAKTIDGKLPLEYHTLTLCSRECWEKAGKPDD